MAATNQPTPSGSKPLLDPKPISFATPIGDIEGIIVVEFEEPEGLVLAEVRQASRTISTISFRRSTSIDPLTHRSRDSRELGDVLISMLSRQPLRAFSLPYGTISTQGAVPPSSYRGLIFLVMIVSVVCTLIFVESPQLMWLVCSLVGLASIGAYRALRHHSRGKSWHYLHRGHHYSFDELLNERPRLEQAMRRVDQIKERYGELLADIVYRIENSALFDPAVEPTRDFTEALIRWDSSHETLTAAEVSTLAARIELSFERAKQHAETLGLGHLPEGARRDGERAAKAARLSKSSRSAHESTTALNQALEILDGLRLYYLPTRAEALAITGGVTRPALPGRIQQGRD